jgi:hypothetical protein
MLSPTRTSVPSVEDAFLNADTKVAINGPRFDAGVKGYWHVPISFDYL